MFKDLLGREIKTGDRILFFGLYKRRRFHATAKVSNAMIVGDHMYSGRFDSATGTFCKDGWYWQNDGKPCYQVIRL